jgi:hypothetical protein
MNTIDGTRRTRSATAPKMRAGVTMANMSWYRANVSADTAGAVSGSENWPTFANAKLSHDPILGKISGMLSSSCRNVN